MAKRLLRDGDWSILAVAAALLLPIATAGTWIVHWHYHQRRAEKRNKDDQKIEQQSDGNNDDETTTRIPLLGTEEFLLSYQEHPISTITWFQGDCIKAFEVIKRRLEDIVAANPWLVGGTWSDSDDASTVWCFNKRPVKLHPPA